MVDPATREREVGDGEREMERRGGCNWRGRRKEGKEAGDDAAKTEGTTTGGKSLGRCGTGSRSTKNQMTN